MFPAANEFPGDKIGTKDTTARVACHRSGAPRRQSRAARLSPFCSKGKDAEEDRKGQERSWRIRHHTPGEIVPQIANPCAYPLQPWTELNFKCETESSITLAMNYGRFFGRASRPVGSVANTDSLSPAMRSFAFPLSSVAKRPHPNFLSSFSGRFGSSKR